MSTGVSTAAPVRAWWTKTDGWTRVRLLLVALWILVSLLVLGVGQRYSSYADLQDAVSAGLVKEVTIVGALPPESTGHGLVEVTWHAGGIGHLTEVRQVSSGYDASSPELIPSDEYSYVYEDVGQQLRSLQPDLQVDAGSRPPVYGDLFGWRVPIWLTYTAAIISAVKLVVLVRGPQPRWATRWAWFWLSWNYIGALMFLLLSGHTPGIPAPREGRRRLTGGWALLSSTVLVLVITSALG